MTTHPCDSCGAQTANAPHAASGIILCPACSSEALSPAEVHRILAETGIDPAANPHVMECNYRFGPIGAPGCICRVVNRALSSGERVRALEEALRVIEIEVSMFLDEDDGQVARLHTVLNVIRALSPQGDASLPSTDAPDTKEPTT